MSLTAPPVRQFAYAIFASKNLDDPSFLAEAIGGNLAAIGHIYTNGANQLVIDFGVSNGIPVTVFPLCGSTLPTSTHLILEKVDAAYLIADESSKSAAQIKDMCEKKGVVFKWLAFEPVTHWKAKVCRAQEILSALPKELLEEEWVETLAQLRKVL